jgi:hypothetical protein
MEPAPECLSGADCDKPEPKPSCAAGELTCDGECANPKLDNANCGACGNACAAGTECLGGSCVCSFGERCGDSCVDTTVDASHCGACGNACGNDARCEAGTCKPKVTDPCDVPGGVLWQDKRRFMFGMNYAWHHFGGDFGGIAAWEQPGIAANPAIPAEVADMAQHGVNVIRWWLWPSFRGDGVTFDESLTPTGLGGTALEDLEKALAIAEENDVYLMLTLFSFDGFAPDGESHGIFTPGLAPIAKDPSKRAALVNNVVRPFARAVAKSPLAHRVVSWDVMNEPEWAMTGPSKYCGDQAFDPMEGLEALTHDQMETFVADVTAGLHEESRAHVTVGSAAMKWKCAFSKVDLDFYQFHTYDWVNAYWPYTKGPKSYGLTDKPVVMGEFPIQGLSSADTAKLLDAYMANGYGGALAWSYSDTNYPWTDHKSEINAFAKREGCKVKY